MRYEFYILIPWAVIIPIGIIYLLKNNYRINSGLCPQCGSKIEKEITENVYNTDKTVMDIKCKKCEATKPKSSIIKTILIILFAIWVFTSIAIFRRISLVG